MTNLPKIKATDDINAVLVLADGQFFFGQGVGKIGSAKGEVCFNTSLTGYQEILTDPSYTGQIINFTMPHIGNVGVNLDDHESKQNFANGLILRDPITDQASFRAESHLNDWLIKNGLTGISGVDTRAITILIREKGAQNCTIHFAQNGAEINVAEILIDTKKQEPLKGKEISSEVSSQENTAWETISYKYQQPEISNKSNHHIVVIDYGVKSNILNCLKERGSKITVVNCKTSAADILKLRPAGVFLSNGPGDPDANALYAVKIIKTLLEQKIPIFGICMGHQLLALAAGLKTFKMRQGHRGANHPVKNLITGQVEITSQNHGFCVEKENLPDNIEISHISLFDQTIEGIRLKDRPAFSVQYHPESSPGPHDSKYLFDDFINLIESSNA